MANAAFRHDLAPHNLSTLHQNFLAVFPRRDSFIWKPHGMDRWQKAKGPLPDHRILEAISDNGHPLYRGCYWSHKTSHAVLDLDQGSKYHSALELSKLVTLFHAIGINLKPYQSSHSGGWHLYIFFDSWEDSAEVNQRLKDYLRANSYEIKSGTLEIFPSGNALRLPLQRGFAWLGSDTSLILKREEITERFAIAQFLEDKEKNACSWKHAESCITSHLSNLLARAGTTAQDHQEAIANEGFDLLFRRGLDWEKYQRGRQYWLTGLTARKQRHDAVICIGHYLWYGDPSNDLAPLPGVRNAEVRATKIRACLEKLHNGYSKAVDSNNQKEHHSDIERAARWTRQNTELTNSKENYPLTERLLKRLQWLYQKTGKLWTVEELEKANIDRSLEARQRIAIAITQLENEGQRLTFAAIARKAGADRRTVKKNSDLLACCVSEYSGGSGGLSSSPLVFIASAPAVLCFPSLSNLHFNQSRIFQSLSLFDQTVLDSAPFSIIRSRAPPRL